MSADASGHARSLRRAVIVAVIAIAVLLTLFSRAFGRAETIGSYRPELPAPALTNGCWPLPPGLKFGFPYQVRADETMPDGQRRIVMQYDLVDQSAILADLRASFAAAGFESIDSPEPGSLAFDQPELGPAAATVEQLPGIAGDSIVRGTIELVLPATPSTAAPGNPWCENPFSTKRFPPEPEPAS